MNHIYPNHRLLAHIPPTKRDRAVDPEYAARFRTPEAQAARIELYVTNSAGFRSGPGVFVEGSAPHVLESLIAGHAIPGGWSPKNRVLIDFALTLRIPVMGTRTGKQMVLGDADCLALQVGQRLNKRAWAHHGASPDPGPAPSAARSGPRSSSRDGPTR